MGTMEKFKTDPFKSISGMEKFFGPEIRKMMVLIHENEIFNVILALITMETIETMGKSETGSMVLKFGIGKFFVPRNPKNEVSESTNQPLHPCRQTNNKNWKLV